MFTLRFARRVIVTAVMLLVALIGSSVAVGQVMKNPELAYMSYDGRTTALYILDLGTGIAGALRGTEGVSFFAWSPDGRWIAVIVGHELNNPLYLLSADGVNRRQIAQVEYTDKSPWSPDGKQLAFTRNDDGQYHLYVMGVDGSQPQSLLGAANTHANPLWSPDGRYIAFLSYDGTFIDLGAVAVDGTQRRVFSGYGDVDFAWSSQGHSLAFVKPDGIYLADVSGGTETRITEATHLDKALSWSPDGKTLAFISIGDPQRQSISIATSGGIDRQLHAGSMTIIAAGNLAWSADGRQIAFTAYSPHDVNADIYVSTLDGQIRRVTFSRTVDWLPSWRP
jgi:Tol biopolymer transport system component